MLKFELFFPSISCRGSHPIFLLRDTPILPLYNSSETLKSLTTLVEGNEPEGSFYLVYYCESSVETALVTVDQHNNKMTLSDTLGTAVVGDTIRINSAEESIDKIAANWRYYTIKSVDGVNITVERTVAMASGDYYAEYGNFFSGPGMDYGVSTNCLQADPDITNNPLDHDVSGSILKDELQGLAQVNSSAGCLEVRVVPSATKHCRGS